MQKSTTVLIVLPLITNEWHHSGSDMMYDREDTWVRELYNNNT